LPIKNISELINPINNIIKTKSNPNKLPVVKIPINSEPSVQEITIRPKRIKRFNAPIVRAKVFMLDK